MKLKRIAMCVGAAIALCLPVQSLAAKGASPISIIPTPNALNEQKGQLTLPKSLTIGISDESLRPAAQYLARALGGVATPSIAGGAGNVQLKLATSGYDTPGAYTLTSAKAGVTIEAGDYGGIINGIASLRQLLPPQVGMGAKAKTALTLPLVSITDAPRYGWRGMMLDCSRHFWSVDEVKQLLDLMALYKFNRFHWHLCDDQGWRMEIKRYPQLTQDAGAYRTLNNGLDEGCEKRAKDEHNPDMRVDRSKMKVNAQGDSVYGGYYTQAQLRDVVAYAKNLGIEIMPEIDMPGHSTIITSILDKTRCSTGAVGVICPGRDDAMEIVKNIYDEVFDIFPFKYVDIGGDEVNMDNWKKCTYCAQRMKDEDIDDVTGLQAWFTRQMEAYFQVHGRRLIGWDEIAYYGMSTDAAVMWWRASDHPLANQSVLGNATAAGHRVVCSPTSCLYFDYGQNDASIDNILKLDPRAMNLNEKQQKLVQGMQANIWCEWIPTFDRVEYQIMPRMMALAESAWAATSNKLTFDGFWKIAQPQFLRLDAMGINYRVPDILGIEAKTTFKDKATFKPYTRAANCVLRYTTDGSLPTSKSPLVTKPIVVTKSAKYTVSSFRPNGKRSETAVAEFVKE